jgi:hypothetical protein
MRIKVFVLTFLTLLTYRPNAKSVRFGEFPKNSKVTKNFISHVKKGDVRSVRKILKSHPGVLNAKIEVWYFFPAGLCEKEVIISKFRMD